MLEDLINMSLRREETTNRLAASRSSDPLAGKSTSQTAKLNSTSKKIPTTARNNAQQTDTMINSKEILKDFPVGSVPVARSTQSKKRRSDQTSAPSTNSAPLSSSKRQHRQTRPAQISNDQLHDETVREDAEYDAGLAAARRGKAREHLAVDIQAPTDSRDDNDATSELELFEQIRIIEARMAETRAKYEEDPVESSKRLDPRCGKYVRVAAKSEPFIQSVMTLQHPVLQEAVYNLAVFAQLSRNHILIKRTRDKCLPHLNEADAQSVDDSVNTSRLWVNIFAERAEMLEKYLNEHCGRLPNDAEFRANFRAAREAVPLILSHDSTGVHVNQDVFVSQIDPDTVSDPGESDDEDEDLAAEPVGPTADFNNELNENLLDATHTDEMPPQHAEDEGSDNEINGAEAGQQRDMGNEAAAEGDLENEEVANEDSGEENAAEQAANGDPDEDVTLEISDERSAQQRVLKVTVTLRH